MRLKRSKAMLNGAKTNGEHLCSLRNWSSWGSPLVTEELYKKGLKFSFKFYKIFSSLEFHTSKQRGELIRFLIVNFT